MTSDNDLKTANETFAGFIAMVKWSIPPIVLIVAVVVYLLKA
jgi:hypothetical protein